MLAMREVDVRATDGHRARASRSSWRTCSSSSASSCSCMYVHHIGQSLRVSALIELVGNDTRSCSTRSIPTQVSREPRRQRGVVCAPQSGVVTAIGHDQLVDEARGPAARSSSCPRSGRSCPPVRRCSSSTASRTRLDDDAIASRWCSTRTDPRQDVAYGMRHARRHRRALARRLAVPRPDDRGAGIDRLHDCLRQLARRPFPTASTATTDGRRAADRAGDGLGRVRPPRVRRDPAWREPAHRRSRAAEGGARRPRLDRVAGPPPVLEEQLELFEAAIEQEMEGERDADFALHPDREGIGAAVAPER